MLIYDSEILELKTICNSQKYCLQEVMTMNKSLNLSQR